MVGRIFRACQRMGVTAHSCAGACNETDGRYDDAEDDYVAGAFLGLGSDALAYADADKSITAVTSHDHLFNNINIKRAAVQKSTSRAAVIN